MNHYYLIGGMIEDVIGGLLGGLGKAIFSFLVAFLQFVFGWLNDFACALVDIVIFILPRTPANLKISYLVSIHLANMSFGQAVVIEIFTMISSFAAVVILIKLYKLIPFKMS